MTRGRLQHERERSATQRHGTTPTCAHTQRQRVGRECTRLARHSSTTGSRAEPSPTCPGAMAAVLVHLRQWGLKVRCVTIPVQATLTSYSPLAILLGRLRKGTEDCRSVLRLINKSYSRLCVVPSSYIACAGLISLRRSLADLCDHSCLVQGAETTPDRCDMYDERLCKQCSEQRAAS